MKTPEGQLKEEVKKLLSGMPNLFFWMPVPTGYGTRGIPDFVGCYYGIFFGIETKAPNGKETPWQRIVREKITNAGGFSIVTHDIEAVRALLRKIYLLRLRDPNAGADNSGC